MRTDDSDSNWTREAALDRDFEREGSYGTNRPPRPLTGRGMLRSRFDRAQELPAAIVRTIQVSVTAVLAQKGITDPNGALATELARNAAQSVVFLLDSEAV